MNFVIHWNETAMGLHVFPIPIPPPTSLSTRSLQVFPVHQVQALVSCIQPGQAILYERKNWLKELEVLSFSLQNSWHLKSCFLYLPNTCIVNEWHCVLQLWHCKHYASLSHCQFKTTPLCKWLECILADKAYWEMSIHSLLRLTMDAQKVSNRSRAQPSPWPRLLNAEVW